MTIKKRKGSKISDSGRKHEISYFIEAYKQRRAEVSISAQIKDKAVLGNRS